MNRKKMLNDVKVGDTLLWVHGASYSQSKTLVSVERITETQIITKVGKFRKRNGSKVGDTGGSFTSSFVRPITDEEIAKLKEEKERIARQSAINAFFYLNQGAKVFEDEDAKQILTIIQKYTKK